MEFVPYYKLEGIPNIAVDGSAHPDSKLVLSHWIDSGTEQSLMRDTSAQIVLDFLKEERALPENVNAVSNDHFDQDGLVGIFSLVQQKFALKHYELLVDITTSGDFGKYKSREAARCSMAFARMIHPSSEIIKKEYFSKPYPEMAAEFYRKGIELLPQMVENIREFKNLWSTEDEFLSKCEESISSEEISIEELPEHDLAIVRIPKDYIEDEFHRFTVIMKGPLHDMALHSATKMGRIIYSYGDNLIFKYRYETWVQLENNIQPLRVGLERVAEKLTEIDNGEWKYQGSNKLVALLQRVDKGDSSVSLELFRDLLIEAFNTEKVDWNPYP